MRSSRFTREAIAACIASASPEISSSRRSSLAPTGRTRSVPYVKDGGAGASDPSRKAVCLASCESRWLARALPYTTSSSPRGECVSFEVKYLEKTEPRLTYMMRLVSSTPQYSSAYRLAVRALAVPDTVTPGMRPTALCSQKTISRGAEE